MWFDPPKHQPDWSAGVRTLRKADKVLSAVISDVGPCTLQRRRDYFVVLCKSIFSQQISVAVATVLFGRFRDQFPGRRPTPERVLTFLTTATPELIRACGVSRQKQAYLIDLAEHFVSGTLPTPRFNRMTDDEIVAALGDVNGIGRWTAEMFLIFVLNRPDVFPVDDLGLKKAVQRAFELPTVPTARQLQPYGDRWKPFRSLATWYLWRMPLR